MACADGGLGPLGYSEKVCVICGGDIESENYVNVGLKGLQALIRGATVFKNTLLKEYLLADTTASVKVHDRCWKKYRRRRQLETLPRTMDEL